MSTETPDRWATLMAFVDAKFNEIDTDPRASIDSDYGHRLTGALGAYRKVGSRMAELEAEQPGAVEWHENWNAADRDPDGNLILRYAPTGGLYRVIPVEG